MEAGVVIVGSGPAGVSAAWPLVSAGIKVTMIEAGTRPIAELEVGRPSLHELREGGGKAWKHLLGADLRGACDTGDLSARLRLYSNEFNTAATQSLIDRDGFHDVMVNAHGGLSNVWGAVCCALNDQDLASWPIGEVDLNPSYQSVAARIGISGSISEQADAMLGRDLPLQPALPLSGNAQYLSERYGTSRISDALQMVQARSAVLTEKLGERDVCRLDRACMLGCSISAVYNSSREIHDLSRHANFEFVDSVRVDQIERMADGFKVSGIDVLQGVAVEFNCKKLVMAAGTMGSTRLTLQLLGQYNKAIPMQNSPAVAVPFWLPRRLGASMEKRGYGMAQLALSMPLPGNPSQSCFGLLYDADVFPVSDIVKRMPISIAGGRRVAKTLLSSLMIGLFYFPGEYSNNTVMLECAGAEKPPLLLVKGAESQDYRDVARQALEAVKSKMRNLGAFALPGADQFLAPGSEVHCGATFPMGGTADNYGQINGLHGYFVVDGASLSGIPSKNHTFTIMANADRIGRYLASN